MWTGIVPGKSWLQTLELRQAGCGVWRGHVDKDCKRRIWIHNVLFIMIVYVLVSRCKHVHGWFVCGVGDVTSIHIRFQRVVLEWWSQLVKSLASLVLVSHWIKCVTYELGDKEAARAVKFCIICVALFLFYECRLGIEKSCCSGISDASEWSFWSWVIWSTTTTSKFRIRCPGPLKKTNLPSKTHGIARSEVKKKAEALALRGCFRGHSAGGEKKSLQLKDVLGVRNLEIVLIVDLDEWWRCGLRFGPPAALWRDDQGHTRRVSLVAASRPSWLWMPMVSIAMVWRRFELTE